MANKKFSEFVLKTSTSDVSHIVGYNGAENVQITPANFVTGGGTGVFLPLAGGTMVGVTQFNDHTQHGDQVQARFGAGNDLIIEHNGGNSFITDNGTGVLNIQGSTQVNIGGANGTIGFQFVEGANTAMRHNNVTKLSTNSTGISVTGDGTFSGNVTINGDGKLLKFTPTSYDNVELGIDSNGFVIYNSTDARYDLKIDGTGNATFGGNVILGIADSLYLNGTTGVRMLHDGSNALFINQTAGDFILQNSVSNKDIAFKIAGSERMRLDSSGNLGIGTSTPNAKLDVSGNVVINHTAGVLQTKLNVEGSAMPESSDAASVEDLFTLYRYGSNTVWAGGASLALGRYSSGGSSNPKSRLDFKLKDAIGNTALPEITVMTMQSNGNVGIGTSSPAYKFHLLKSSGDTEMYINGQNGESSLRMGLDSRNWQIKTAAAPYLWSLNYVGTDAPLSNILTANVSGNLGVGTSSPASLSSSTSSLTVGSSRSDLSGAIYLQSNGVNKAQLYWDGGTVNDTLDGDTKWRTAASERMRLTSAGDLLIGTTTALTTSSTYGNITVDGSITVGPNLGAITPDAAINVKEFGGNQISFFYGTAKVGGITSTSSATAYNTSSDYRLKEDLQDFKGLDLVSKIPVYDYKWKADKSRSYGVMAHELEEVLPQAVSGEKDAEEMQSVDYSKIVPLLVKSIQELSAKLEALECQCEKK